MVQTESALRRTLRAYIDLRGRGAAQEICLNTELTASEISNWLSGRRELPAHKLVSVYDWLISSGKATVTFDR